MSNTTAYKTRDGWTAKDTITIGPAKGSMGREGERVLQVSTYKARRGGLVTQATCAVRTADGCISFELFGDFSEPIASSPDRCTERTVRSLHASAMTGIDAVLAKARAFYEAKDAKADLHAKREGSHEATCAQRFHGAAECTCKVSALDFPAELAKAGCSG